MKKIRSLSIVSQITLRVTILISLSIILTSIILIILAFRAQIHEVMNTQVARTDAVAAEINAYVDDLQSQLAYLARVQGLSVIDVTIQQSLLNGLIRRNSAYENVAIIDKFGEVLVSVSRGDMMLSDDQSLLPVFRYAYDNQEEFVGSVEFDPDLEIPFVKIAVPIRDWENRVDGVLLATVNLRFLWSVISRMAIGEEGYVYVIDRSQFLIAQQGDTVDTFNVRDISELPYLQPLIYGEIDLETPYQGLRGVEVFGRSAFIASADWYVIVELPVVEVYTPAYQHLAIMVISLVVSILASVGVSLSLSRQITSPLQQLTRVATRIGEGDLTQRIDLNQDNEFGLLATTFDKMSQRLRETIEALQTSEERHRVLLSANPDLIFRNNAEGVFLDFHTNAPELLYVPVDQIIGRKISETMPPEIVELQQRGIQKTLETGTEQVYEYRLQIGDEWHDFEARMVVSGKDEVLTMAREITDRKQVEKEQLKVLIEKERIKILGTFINQASHEFRTPISTIGTSLHLLKKAPDPERNEKRIDKIRDQMEQITKLVDSLTLMAQLDSGVHQFVNESVNLNDILDVIQYDTRAILAQKQINLVRKNPESAILMIGDFDFIRQAIQRLVDNAIMATSASGTVTLEAKQTDTEVMIEVTDTGTGITEENLPFIFDRFYRADKAGTTRGFGLGLPIAKAIVDFYHGKIDVETQVGVGSTFRVRIPRNN